MAKYVEVKNLVKNFGTFRAVDDISLTVSKGEVLGFLGPNGAGKTTTMRMITGYIHASSGDVTVCGQSIKTHPIDIKKRIGYLPEGAPLYPDISARMFLEFIGQSRALDAPILQERLDYVIHKLHLEPVIDKAIDTLSKGFKRRVGLAQAILHNPDILILDEPTDGLDPIQKHEVRQLIKEMSNDKAIIISTHILEEVEAICSRAIIIAQGKIVADGTPESLLSKHPRHHCVELTIKTQNADDCAGTIKNLAFVDNVHVTETNENVTFYITPKETNDIVYDISQLAYQNQWNVIALTSHRGRLDEVFRDIASTTSSHH